MFITFNKYLKYKHTNTIYHSKNQTINKFKSTNHNKSQYFFICNYCTNIEAEYIEEKTEDKNNKLLLYTIIPIDKPPCNIDKKTIVSSSNIAGILMYRIILYTNAKIRIYIPLMSIHKNVRNCGYGKHILETFINMQKTKHLNKTIEIVLLSLDTSISFYEKMGFSICSNKYIEEHETINKDEIIMRIII